jgi:hypothetical protein
MKELDASLLTLAILGYDSPETERLEAHGRRARTGCCGLGPSFFRSPRRGRSSAAKKAPFLLPARSGWSDAFAPPGHGSNEARSLMEELIGVANDVGALLGGDSTP